MFTQESLEYLERIISSQGVALGKSKIEAILNLPVPKIVIQLRGF